MIRLSTESDKKGIINLWQEAFGDSTEAVEIFLDKKYIAENTVICEENGKVASMLFLLEGKLKIRDEKFNAYYLYAAATLKEFRGRGIMAKMLDFSKKLADERNIDFICLKPAEKSLYGYYGKFGYKDIFASKKININLTAESECEIGEDFSIINKGILRNNVFADVDGFEWDKDSVDYAVMQHKYYGGAVFENCKGYLLYDISDGKCTVKECCFTNDYLHNALSFLQRKTGITDFVVEIPFSYKFNGSSFEICKNGMAQPISDKAVLIIDELNNLYLNLTLD